MKLELIYLDSSALVKLVTRERETAALLAYLGDHGDGVSSGLAPIEVMRTPRRARAKREELRQAAEVLARIALVRLDDDILESAAALGPPEPRSLDAIHIATALSLGSDLAGVISYDSRFSAAATRVGLPVLTPG